MISREKIPSVRRWVIKIGSTLLTADGKGLSRQVLSVWVEQMAALRHAGHEVVVVSSGAVAEGMSRMGWRRRPHNLNELQAAAAIGQMGLVHTWEACFQQHGLHTAQVLLTRDDLADRARYLNARSTLRTLLQLGVVPVVNENDTVTIDELRFGDNDTLAALVANLIEAELLVLLTDQEGLFDADPRSNPDASLIDVTRVDDPQLDRVAGASSSGLGLGGMVKKNQFFVGSVLLNRPAFKRDDRLQLVGLVPADRANSGVAPGQLQFEKSGKVALQYSDQKSS